MQKQIVKDKALFLMFGYSYLFLFKNKYSIDFLFEELSRNFDSYSESEESLSSLINELVHSVKNKELNIKLLLKIQFKGIES